MNPPIIGRFPFTKVALGLAFLVLMASVFWNINVFALPGVSIVGIEQDELGEVVIAFLLVIPAFFVDDVFSRQRAHETRIQTEQLRVLRMTMRTVQDIVGNALMSLYLFRAEAEPSVSPVSLAQFDHIIADTAAKLKAISDLKTVVETQMAAGPGVHYHEPSPART